MCSLISVTTYCTSIRIHYLQQQQPFHGVSSSLSSHNMPNDSNRPDIKALSHLHHMFIKMNVDDELKPSILSYKSFVESIPPPRGIVIGLSILRSFPTLVVLCFHRFMVGYVDESNYAAVVILFPLIILELYRKYCWIHLCLHMMDIKYDKESLGDTIDTFYNKVDPMIVLLVNDDDHGWIDHQATLIIIWQNRQRYVCAFESGVTTI